MKVSMGLITLVGIALFLGATPAAAASYQDFHCSCRPLKLEPCSCFFTYQLGKFQTKEFRGYCDQNDTTDGDPWPEVYVSDRDKNTTCTIYVDGIPGEQYTSKSCTNWSWSSRDNIKIEVKCLYER